MVLLVQDFVILAAVRQHLCNSVTPWDDIQALVASHLIALDKCPGVRLIGGEIF